ncbi:hypothetical protein ACFZ8E_19165 [Methylobacterium sp. HMF5984]|uniref:hypothetical protein n=1 Tax=Methylobacterium sp. HMF5984 TaxID=3367370 RepID=UPI003853142D
MKDPVRLAVATFRHRSRDLGEARKLAEQEYAETHAPVPSPIPAMIHRDVADILARFLVASGLGNADLLAPLQDHERVEDIEARHVARLQADLEEARAELVRVERKEALDRLEAAQKALEEVDAMHARPVVELVDEAPVEAPVPVPSLDQVNKALAEQESVIAAVEDAPRRRGRPRKGAFVDISDLPVD